MVLEFWFSLEIDDILSDNLDGKAGNVSITVMLSDILAKRQEQLIIAFDGLLTLAFGTLCQLIPFDELLYIRVNLVFHDLYPIATVILSEVVLQEERTAFFFTVSLSNGGNIPLVSPWVVYSLVYALLSLVLIRLQKLQ